MDLNHDGAELVREEAFIIPIQPLGVIISLTPGFSLLQNFYSVLLRTYSFILITTREVMFRWVLGKNE